MMFSEAISKVNNYFIHSANDGVLFACKERYEITFTALDNKYSPYYKVICDIRLNPETNELESVWSGQINNKDGLWFKLSFVDVLKLFTISSKQNWYLNTCKYQETIVKTVVEV